MRHLVRPSEDVPAQGGGATGCEQAVSAWQRTGGRSARILIAVNVGENARHALLDNLRGGDWSIGWGTAGLSTSECCSCGQRLWMCGGCWNHVHAWRLSGGDVARGKGAETSVPVRPDVNL